MESLYSGTSRFQSQNGGERSCPDFDNFIQKTGEGKYEFQLRKETFDMSNQFHRVFFWLKRK